MLSVEDAYKEYSDMLYRWLLARTGDPDVAEEITQETFYQAVLHADRYDRSYRVSTWLCSIASNKLKEYYRKNPPKENYDAMFGEGSPKPQTLGPEDEVVSAQRKVALYRAIPALPEPSREVVHLRAFSDLSFKEIGDIFGKTEGWARITFYRAKAALRKELTENE